MRRRRRLPALVLVGLWVGVGSARAQADSGAAAVRRADSLFAAGDRPAARDAYLTVLAAEPQNSHATYRLAQLTDDPAAAFRLYEAYVRLEPSDPWGYMALGTAAAHLRRYGEALQWYDSAAVRAPEERDVAMGRARVYERAGRPEAAIATYSEWLLHHPNDAEAWRDLGRQDLRAGRPDAATRALGRSLALERNEQASALLARAQALQAPAVEPAAGGSRDSDGNTVSSLAVRADVAVADGARLGFALKQSSVADGLDVGEADALTAVGSWRVRAALRLDWAAGVGRISSSAAGLTTWTAYPMGDVRLRFSAPGGGGRVDLRASQDAVALSPTLTANHVMRSEVSARISLPAGPIVLRGLGRLGVLTADPVGRAGPGIGTGAALQRNRRALVGGALAVPLGDAVEINGQVQRLTYAEPSSVGYFAPREADLVDFGSYMEFTPLPRWDVALDVGAGAQRMADQGAPLGPWREALRLYALSSLELTPGSYLTLEVEAYDAPLATEAAATSQSWRWGSATLSLHWAVR